MGMRRPREAEPLKSHSQLDVQSPGRRVPSYDTYHTVKPAHLFPSFFLTIENIHPNLALCSGLCRAANVNTGYRVAPDHTCPRVKTPFPTGMLVCWAVPRLFHPQWFIPQGSPVALSIWKAIKSSTFIKLKLSHVLLFHATNSKKDAFHSVPHIFRVPLLALSPFTPSTSP